MENTEILDPFKKERRAERTKRAREKVLLDIYGEDTEVPLEASALSTSRGHCYISDPTRELSPRKKLIGDLVAQGMKQTEIAKHLGISKTSVCTSVRDPRVYQYIEEARKDLTSQAKELLNGAVLKAATNVVDAVEKGDLKESHFILGHSGIVEKRESANSSPININFGDWLLQGSNTKEMHNDAIANTHEVQRVDYITDVDLLPENTEGGERL
jgi:predicted transcriptional regulator